ncbi:MAG TPA: hypothetical protein VHV79_08570 [Mycobacteriales bacterium]|nr:hypothetical protein [Mycobacteriales bacterium]
MSRRATAAVLIAWSLLAIGDSAHAGYYSTFGLVCILLGFATVLGVVAFRLPLVAPDRNLLVVPALVCLVLAIINPTKRYLYLAGRDLHAIEALSIATATAVALTLLAGERWQRAAWSVVLSLAAATGIVTIVLINDPNIDVWVILQQSATGLLHGKDMYRQHWVGSTGLQNAYPYLPGSTLLLAPFRWLFGDVRYGLLVASLLGAWLLRRFGATRVAALPALIFVVPGWVYLVNRSWTEPLLVVLLAAAILAIRSGRTTLAVVAFALALASKQHVVLLLPLFALWPSFGLRRTASSVGLAILVVAPWVIAGPRDFWHDAVHANLSLGAETKALNLQALLLRHNVTVGFWFLAVFMLAAYAVVLWRAPRTPSGLALSGAVVMWTFDLANSQTFFNHYILPIGLVVIALATADADSSAQPVS